MTDDTTPSVRLAAGQSPRDVDFLSGEKGYDLPRESWPSVLVSYVYVETWLKVLDRARVRSWVLDSGAFTAQRMGKPVDLEAYIDFCHRARELNRPPLEVFALDVIGDWRASIKNYERMVLAGIPAIPTYHIGEPEEALMELAAAFPKIALGGIVGVHKQRKAAWIGECFNRVWPKAIHGFGCGSEALILGFPFHSTDASNWQVGACKFGQWTAFGGAKLSWRGSNQNLRVEIEHYLRIERQARHRWAAAMKELPALEPLSTHLAYMPGAPCANVIAPRVDLGVQGGEQGTRQLAPRVDLGIGNNGTLRGMDNLLEPPPSVMLVVAPESPAQLLTGQASILVAKPEGEDDASSGDPVRGDGLGGPPPPAPPRKRRRRSSP